MVAGWCQDRFFLRRIGRVRAAHQESEWPGGDAENRSRHARIVLLLSDVVPRQQEDCVYRQTPQPVVRGYREESAGKGVSRPLHRPAANLPGSVVAGQQVAGLYTAGSEPHAVRLFALARDGSKPARDGWDERVFFAALR